MIVSLDVPGAVAARLCANTAAEQKHRGVYCVPMRPLRIIVIFWVCLLCAPVHAAEPDELDFLTNLTESRDLRKMLPDALLREADRRLDNRAAAISGIGSAADFARRGEYVRARMAAAVGGFPQRTPLNARVTGTLDRGDYRIEKVIFESQPGFYVTGNLYVPQKGSGPYPAILFPLGHETGGKANPTWQQMLGSLAKKGYLVFAWDPIGQGERIQVWDEDWQDSKFFASTVEHTEEGIQCLLVGDAVARYTIWDGLRALDYLLSRPEADSKRVGCTGNSGGGTHTSYLAALDDRIQVAAPSCYITSWRRLLTSIGPQDAEQVFPSWLKNELDFPDFLYAFGPKPFLILSAIRDFFPIDGARDSFAEARRVFRSAGAGDKVDMVEADDGHGYSKPRRIAAYRWFARWLKQENDDAPEPDVVIARPEDLWATPTGQVVTSLGGETVFSLNRKREQLAKSGRPAFSMEKIRELTGFVRPQGDLRVRTYGVAQREGFRMEKLTYESEPGITIPALLYLPEGAASKRPAVIAAAGKGKTDFDGNAVRLARQGAVVLSLDVRGTGEIRPPIDTADYFYRYFGDFETTMTAILLGRTMPGLRAQDIVRAADLLESREEVDPKRISGFGKASGAAAMLYAAAFDPRIRKLGLEDMLVSYGAVVARQANRGIFDQIVPSALKFYDLPDVVRALAPRPVWIIDPLGPAGQRLPEAAVSTEYSSPNVRVVNCPVETGWQEVYRDWAAVKE